MFFDQEFFIRHMDGTPINSEAEKQRVILCIVAAIKRRASQVKKDYFEPTYFFMLVLNKL